MSTNVGSIHYDLDLDTKKFHAETSKISSSIGDFGKKLAVGAAVAGAAVTAFGISAVKSFQDSENAGAQLNAVLKSTGGVAGWTADEANKLASSLQKTTMFSDEAVLSAENMLLTFTNIGKEVFPDATKTVLDMSQALGQDTKSSAIQLGKALNNPIDGITALTRVGVKFTDAQKTQIESLVKAGKTMEAQKIILGELKTEFGGSAEAAGKTFAGKMAILKNQMDDVKESIGGMIVGALTPLAGKLSNFVASDQFQAWLKQVNEWIAINLPKALAWLTTTAFPMLKAVLDVLWPVVKVLWDMFAGLVTFFSEHMWAFWALVDVFVAIKLAMMLNGALVAFQAVMTAAGGSYIGLATMISSSPIIMPAIAIAAALAAIALVWKSYNEMRDAIEARDKAASSYINSQSQLKRDMQALAKNGSPEQKARANKWLSSFATGTKYAPGGLALVGERGPELVNLPHGAQVNTAQQTKGMLGNSESITINIGSVQNQSDADYILRRLNRDMKRVNLGVSPA